MPDKDNKESNKSGQSSRYYPLGTPKIIKWMVQYSGGIIRNIKVAYGLLYGFLIVAIIITVLIFLQSISSNYVNTNEFKEKNRPPYSPRYQAR